MKFLPLVILILMASAMTSGTHPMDVAVTTLQIGARGLRGTPHIHPYELTLLVRSGAMIYEALYAEIASERGG